MSAGSHRESSGVWGGLKGGPLNLKSLSQVSRQARRCLQRHCLLQLPYMKLYTQVTDWRSLLCSLQFGGSLIRPEATGYGLVYFVKEMLEDKGDSFEVRWQISRSLYAPPCPQIPQCDISMSTLQHTITLLQLRQMFPACLR